MNFTPMVLSLIKNIGRWFFYWIHGVWILGMLCVFFDHILEGQNFDMYLAFTLLGGTIIASFLYNFAPHPYHKKDEYLSQ